MSDIKMKRIYISGKITGLPVSEVREKFDAAEQELAAQGYEVVNPLKTAIPYGAEWETHMTVDILLLTGCDAIYLLSDWLYSRGATLEKRIAEITGKEIIFQQNPQNPELDGLKQAIEDVTGISFFTIACKKRDRTNVYARMIYAHFAHKCGVTISDVAAEMRHNRSTVIYYLKKFDDESRYNPEFYSFAKQVENIINNQ
jgi:hypothetical protein